MNYFGFLPQVRFATEYSWCPGRIRNATCDFPAAPDVGKAWNLLLRKTFLHTAARAGIPAVPKHSLCPAWTIPSSPAMAALPAFVHQDQNISWCRCDRSREQALGSGLLSSPADDSPGHHPPKSHPHVWLLWVKMGSLQQGKSVPFWLPHSSQIRDVVGKKWCRNATL